MQRDGGCLCGAVRFRTQAEPLNVRNCHCRACQKALSSPFFSRALFNQGDVTIQGSTEKYLSSEALERVFCPKCGSRLFARRTNGTYIGIAVTAFDDRHAFAPTEHIWTSEKVDWLTLDDDLAQYEERSPHLP